LKILVASVTPTAIGASPDIEPAVGLAYPDRRKTRQTNRLAVSKLMVNETFPERVGKSLNRFPNSSRRP
jgi:hypothetical protein